MLLARFLVETVLGHLGALARGVLSCRSLCLALVPGLRGPSQHGVSHGLIGFPCTQLQQLDLLLCKIHDRVPKMFY